MKKLLTAAAVAVTMIAAGIASLLEGAQPLRRMPARPRLTPTERKVIVHARYGTTNWPLLGEPKPGEWLSFFPEPGRTYGEYVRDARNLKTDHRDTIYLQPLGRMDSAETVAVGHVAEFARIFFACKVVVRQAVPLPRAAYVPQRGQYDASEILRRMAQRVPDDALAFVGLTSADLYSGRLAYVFGLGSLDKRVGIVSLRRFGEPGTSEFLRRSLRSFAHETGHVFGIRHCIFYRCCMNGSNSLAECDRQPLHYCPLCHDKLRYALGFDPKSRFERLAAWYDTIGFEQDARIVRERLARLAASAKEEP